ncbi:NUDIX domain-containing protein [Candidatus Woesebacteria bacterium]|nr:NUDIX domain-containing protein [Candidatus Woesebacteria bacterium]
MKNGQLEWSVARAVLRAPDMDRKSGKLATHEVLFTVRPGWSKYGKYLPALPGGRFEETDFSDIATAEELENADAILTPDQLTAAGFNAIVREVYEELGLMLPHALLKAIGVTTNQLGGTTYAYAADLPEKPTILVKPESAGVRWIDVMEILIKRPALLSGHLAISRAGIHELGGYTQPKSNSRKQRK